MSHSIILLQAVLLLSIPVLTHRPSPTDYGLFVTWDRGPTITTGLMGVIEGAGARVLLAITIPTGCGDLA
ncbi:hypothetical protein [Roseobacter sp. HKCCA0434]|uniref:hypothetical protein n=1 Tax=Roseobacter sp. HKCCA0434 TaxID=3079297 RepID=UPI002905DD90|nr:hypothetical protein [Roseobacter sp. HKCCA0434]